MSKGGPRQRVATEKTATGRATYPIGTVARLTGLSTHVLRAWEKRYGVEATGRTAGGSRRYTDADIDRLRCIRDLSAYGHSIGDMARLPFQELKSLFDHAAGGSRGRASRGTALDCEAVRRDFLTSLLAMDLATAERGLSRALAMLDAHSFVVEIIVPLLEEVGTAWEKGRLSIAHEHAASAVVRSQLGALFRDQPTGASVPLAVCATLAGELHEFGALCAAAAAATSGWRALYLGPSLPALEIAAAARTARARVVLVSAISLAPEAVLRELLALRRRLGRSVALLAGGHAVEAAGALPNGVTGPMSLTGLSTHLRSLDVQALQGIRPGMSAPRPSRPSDKPPG